MPLSSRCGSVSSPRAQNWSRSGTSRPFSSSAALVRSYRWRSRWAPRRPSVNASLLPSRSDRCRSSSSLRFGSLNLACNWAERRSRGRQLATHCCRSHLGAQCLLPPDDAAKRTPTVEVKQISLFAKSTGRHAQAALWSRHLDGLLRRYYRPFLQLRRPTKPCPQPARTDESGRRRN